jgi:DNA-binding transcriptional MerR regulator
MTLQDEEAQIEAPAAPELPDDAPPAKAMTIGALCKALEQEFPDISISKIRYLEDQKLLAPRRTPGGYRLYSAGDVARLRTILRLQRDEFLPLRVIRQELASGRTDSDLAPGGTGGDGTARRKRRPSVTAPSTGALYSLDDVVEETRAEPRLVAELEDYGVIKGENRAGVKYYDETEPSPSSRATAWAAATCARSARRRTARRRCCSRSSPRRCARGTRSVGRRPSRRSRTSPRSRRTSSTCC